MPYANRKSKKRSKRTKEIIPGGCTTFQAIRKLYRDIMYLKGLINVEYKKHDITMGTDITNSGTIQSLSRVPQGDTNDARDGNSILAKYIQLKFSLVAHASADHTVVRCILFKYINSDGSRS